MSVINMDSRMHLNILWFMGALVCIYILFPAIKSLFDSNRKAFVAFVVVCSVLTFGVVLGQEASDIFTSLLNHRISLVNHDLIKMFNPFKGMHGYTIVYFCVGGLIFTLEDKLLSIKPYKRNLFSAIGLLVSCSILFCLGLFYSKFTDTSWDVVWYGYDTIFTFFNVLFIYVLCLNYKKGTSIVCLVSNNTLGIYFIHQLFIPFITPWIKSLTFMRNVPMNVLYSTVILCISLVLSILINKVSRLKLFGHKVFFWMRL